MWKEIRTFFIRVGFIRSERFHVNPKYFPESTRTVLPTSAILKFGALPLGFKEGIGSNRTLNLGFLNPRETNHVEKVKEMCRTKLGREGFHDIRTYRIRPADLVATLDMVFHVNEQSLRLCSKEHLHPVLCRHLEMNL